MYQSLMAVKICDISNNDQFQRLREFLKPFVLDKKQMLQFWMPCFNRVLKMVNTIT